MIRIGDQTFTVDDVKKHRDTIIELRDGALAQNDFGWSVILSHNIALLANLIDRMEKE